MGRGVAVTPAALLPALLGAKVHHLLHHTGQPFYTVGAHIWLLSLTDRNTGHFHPVPTKTAILPEEHLLQLCLQTNMNQYEPDKLLCTLQSSAQVLCLFLILFLFWLLCSKQCRELQGCSHSSSLCFVSEQHPMPHDCALRHLGCTRSCTAHNFSTYNILSLLHPLQHPVCCAPL